MVWLVVIPLGVWVWLQAQRSDALARRIAELELQLFATRGSPGTASTPAPTDVAPPAPEPAAPQEELLLTEVVPDDVLVLDNPIPEASNDDAIESSAPPSEAPRPRMNAPLLLDEPVIEPPRPEPPRAEPPPQPQASPRRLDRWLAESGLAWIAGIALSMAAIYLVSEASKAAWFTAPVRLASALVLGALILGASEWARRVGLARPPGHPLIAALLAGAGIVVFYATTWAAHGIYDFIAWPVAAALLLLCALALIGLSLLHGQALGVLAIALALLAPAIASATSWPSVALTAYVALVAGGGFALAMFKRWAWVSLVTIGGLYFWFFASISTEDVRRALALLSFASVGGALAALRAPAADDTQKSLSWTAINGLGPSVAVSVSSVLLIWAWLVIAPIPGGLVAGPALISIFHVALAAGIVRERRATPATVAVAIGALALGFTAFLSAYAPPLPRDFYALALFAAFVCILCTPFANAHRSGRAVVAAAGAIGAALLVFLAASSSGSWHSYVAWAPMFIVAALCFGAAWFAEKSAADPKVDYAVGWWAGAGAVLVLLGVESALPAEARTVGHAAAALLFVYGMVWRHWRIAGWATLTATALAVAQSLSPTLISATLVGEIALWIALLIFAGSGALLFAGSTIARRSSANIEIIESMSAAAVIVALAGAFLALSWFAAGGARGVTLDEFTHTSLRVIALMAAGLTLLPRIHEKPGIIGAWRGHVLLGLGLVYALFAPGLAINPWWGGPGRAVVSGLPILNTLAIAFAAPAALAFLAANRLYTRNRLFARIYAIAGGVLAMLWLIMEIRHAFHSGTMAAPEIGLFESSCFGLAFLGFALLVAVVARLRARRNLLRPFTEDLMGAMRAVSWGGVGAAVLIMLLAQHPIWGFHESERSTALSTMLAVLAQAAAMVLSLALGRALSRSKETDPARFAAASAAALFAWSFGHCVIRWLHHRGYMDDGYPPGALEGLAHALWPLLFVVAAAQLTRFVPGRDTSRAYLYDLQAIWSAAIWPALGFCGLGLWLIYNPWWGSSPAEIPNGGAAALALCTYFAAAALSYVAPDVPHVRGMKWMVPAATIACAAHLFMAATLSVRWLYHGAGMATATAVDVELWIYSAVWAVFAAAALGLGTVRNDPVLRWIGLAVFAATILKVFFIDTAALSGVIRAASFFGLGILAAAATWMARRMRPPPGPGDLVTVTPSARRERRRVRRRTSQ
ncbi:MAG: DUF2339 domain-containing protein [Hyphomonadaceae bacterium]